MRNIMTELCLQMMIYNDKLWQSIYETNQESKYLQFCRSKAYCQFRIHCLLEAVCFFNLLTLQDPQWLLYVHFKSSSSFNYYSYIPKCWVFIQNFFVCFITKAMPIFVGNAHFCGQCPSLWAMPIFVGNAHLCGQCPSLWAMPIFVGNALQAFSLVCNAPLRHTQLYMKTHTTFMHDFMTHLKHPFMFILAEIHLWVPFLLLSRLYFHQSLFEDLPINLWTHSCCGFLFRHLLSLFFASFITFALNTLIAIISTFKVS